MNTVLGFFNDYNSLNFVSFMTTFYYKDDLVKFLCDEANMHADELHTIVLITPESDILSWTVSK